MVKRFWLLGMVAVLFLAVVSACDSNDGKGGSQPAAGYTQADLAGEWVLRGGGLLKSLMKFDATGALLLMKNETGKFAPWEGQVAVAPDGSVSGKVVYQLAPGVWSGIAFHSTRFQSKDLITGKAEFYNYVAGVGKLVVVIIPVRMTRYLSD